MSIERIEIKLKFLGDKSEARCFYRHRGNDASKVAWGRNGVEAINKLVSNLRKEVGRGTEFFVDGTPIKGRL